MQIIVPEWVQINQEREKLVSQQIEQYTDLRRELEQLDPHLDLVWVDENVQAVGLVPARWHVVYHSERDVDLYLPILGPDGSYMDPHSGVIQQLRVRDLRNPQSFADLMKEQDRQEAERKKLAQDVKDERAAEFMDLVKHYGTVSIAVPGSPSITPLAA